uniref:RRM domain-containing protein n=1 Tax=Dunaliella tertiolecta TaxID=3047 RepID=A0A7S3VV90_DUNTE|mmetsp:Transcript_5423/g.14647  ORF Transcript_5423/g.14647 Transcript_5423/m.14647 type:complete len:215 (+) Transcript_5423:115-759(+)
MGEEMQEVKIGKRVFVGNLAWRTSWQDLKDKFRECGNVVYANVMRDDDDRSKGWGIVEFETPDEAIAAITTLNGAELGGRRVLVREDREDRDVKQSEGAASQARVRAPRGGRGGAAAGGRGGGGGRAERPEASSGLQLVVRGIPWSYTWKELKDMFAEVAGVERADVVYGDDGRSRGYGTVRFSSPEEAQAALEAFNGRDCEGRALFVFFDKYA